MEKIVNGIVNEFDMDPQSVYWKVRQDFPIIIKFKPVIYNRVTNQLKDISYLWAVQSNGDIANYEPMLKLIIFPDKRTVDQLVRCWGSVDNFNDAITPLIEGIDRIIGGNRFIQDEFKDFNLLDMESQSDVIKYIDKMDDVVNDVFITLNEHYDEVKKLILTMYFKISQAVHVDHVISSINNPNLTFDTDTDNPLFIYRSKYATTYILPNGFK